MLLAMCQAILLKQCEYLGLSLKSRPGKRLLVSSLIDIMSEHHTTSGAPPESINKPLSRKTAAGAEGNEQVTSGQVGNALEGQAEGSNGQQDDAQETTSQKVLAQIQQLGFEGLMKQKRASNLPPFLA